MLPAAVVATPRMAAVVGLLLCGLSLAAPLRADLLSDAQLLDRRWRSDAAKVVRLPPLFLFEGDVRAQSLGRLKRADGECVRVTLLGDRGLQFAVLPTRAKRMSAAAVQQAGQSAEAGVVSIEDCGEGELDSGRLLLAMASPRGSVEVLLSSHKAGLAPVDQVLVQRAAGPRAQAPEAVMLRPLAPLKQRLGRARQVARSDGAAHVVPVDHRADESGAGALALRLASGCHRLHVFADAPDATQAGAAAVDVDAEVYASSLNTVVARDRSHAPDARLDFCLGQSDRVELRYAGAGGPRQMVVMDALWLPPPALPNWGQQWRAGVLTALQRRETPPLREAPIEQALGPAGVNLLPLRLEPHTCYVGVAALSRGEASAMRLSVRYGAEIRYDDAADAPLGASVSFCTSADPEVVLMVDVRARVATWALSLWHMAPLNP